MTDNDGLPAASSAPEPAPISLTEFCLSHSKVERSVELLNAFFAIETAAGRTSGTALDFINRLHAFAAQPAV